MTTFQPNHYYLYDELTSLLEHWSQKYSDLTELESIGQTTEGRKIWLMSVTNKKTGAHHTKPAVWIDANTHAGEVTGSQAALFGLHHLLTNYGIENELTSLLDQLTFYFVPRISADGAEYYLTTPHFVRSSMVKWPYQEMTEAHYSKDIDGNGKILMMRQADPSGAFKVSKKNPQLMVTRTHEDWNDGSETYYRLFTEGEFHQFDGFTQKFARPFGMDLNRNFPAGYRPEGEQGGAGPLPLSLPEADAIAKAVVARPNICVAHTYHTFGAIILRLPTHIPDEKMDQADLRAYKAMCETAAKHMGYKVWSIFKDFHYAPNEQTTGSFDEWLYSHRGIHAATVEIWDIAQQAGVSYDNPMDGLVSPKEDHLLAIYNWCEKNLPPNSFHLDWKPFQHPQLGAVEIGGWDWKFVFQNPPKAFLEAETKKVFAGTLSVAKSCPLVKVKSVQKEKHGELTKVQVTLSNEGYLGTYGSNQALKTASTRPPKVQVQLASGLKLIHGKSEFETIHLKGRSIYGRWHSPVWFAEAPNQHEVRLEWLVSGSGKMKVEVNFERGGIISAEVDL